MKRSTGIHDLVTATLAGRLSRREAIKRASALGVGATAFMAMARGQVAAQASTELEIFSWWTSPGEAPALEALFELYRATYPDVEITNSAVAGGGGGAAQAVLQTRLSGNNPPDSWQVHIGRELFDQYVDAEYTESVSDLYTEEGWNEVVPESLIAQMTKDGATHAVAAGVHRGNGFWYNKQVLADNEIEIGETMTMDQFFTAADALKAKGIPALGLGDKDAFVSPQTFENTLLGVLGPEKYNGLWDGSVTWDDPQVMEAMTVFAKMLDYINDDHSGLDWSNAVDALIQGTVAFNSMGDWAYGEFVAKGVTDKIGYVSHPGTDGSFVLVVDCFTLPKGAPNPENARNWLKVIGTKEGQEAFNPLKGSIPARTDVDTSIFSEYHQWSIESFANDALVPSVAHGEAASPQFKQALYDASTLFVEDRDVEAFSGALKDAAAAEA